MFKGKFRILFIIFVSICSLIAIFNSPYCFGVTSEGKSDASVSVLKNPINTLSEKINDTKELIKQKRQELKEKKNSNAGVFLTLFLTTLFLAAGFLIFNLYITYKKREKRKEKRKRTKKKRKKKKH